jgi:hypothetical protein
LLAPASSAGAAIPDPALDRDRDLPQASLDSGAPFTGTFQCLACLSYTGGERTGHSGDPAYRCVHPPNATRWDDVRFFIGALVVVGFVLPAAGAARVASKSWAMGKITRVSSASIAVRGRVSLSFQTETGAASKSTLDGIRLLTCDVARPGIVLGYHVRNNVTIVCSGGVLSHIAHVG